MACAVFAAGGLAIKTASMKTLLHTLRLIPALLLLAACQQDTAREDGMKAAEQARLENIKDEKPGDYFIGRRYYKKDFKFWGFIRRPGESWGTAKLVILNEQSKLAPDRAQDRIGYDDNYEYRIWGYYTGDQPYDPGSDHFYPEFKLTGYELIATSPTPIVYDKPKSTPAPAPDDTQQSGQPQ